MAMQNCFDDNVLDISNVSIKSMNSCSGPKSGSLSESEHSPQSRSSRSRSQPRLLLSHECAAIAAWPIENPRKELDMAMEGAMKSRLVLSELVVVVG